MDSKGKQRFVGTPDLSQSQNFDCMQDPTYTARVLWGSGLNCRVCSITIRTLGFRTYPRGFASKMLEALECHLGTGQGRRDLRFKPQQGKQLSEVDQFTQLPIGDPWEDANMMELLDYLMTSKRVRTDMIYNECLRYEQQWKHVERLFRM